MGIENLAPLLILACLRAFEQPSLEQRVDLAKGPYIDKLVREEIRKGKP